MGLLSYLLGTEILKQGQDLLLSQKKCILETLKRAWLYHAKLVPTPITTTTNLYLSDSLEFDNLVKYRQIVGALRYVTLSSPYITFSVNKVCQFMHSPNENHWSVVKRIFRYLQGTNSHGLLFKHDFATILHAYTDPTYTLLTGFTDGDWAGCSDDRQSMGDMPFILDLILFHGVHINKRLSHVHPYNLNTKLYLVELT